MILVLEAGGYSNLSRLVLDHQLATLPKQNKTLILTELAHCVADMACELEPCAALEFPPSLCRVIPELKELSEYFRCRVCYSMCSNPVSTPCSHNFCSICVRRYLQYKPQCPECFAPVHEPDLRPNRALKEVMLILITAILPQIQKVHSDGKIYFKKLGAERAPSSPSVPTPSPKTPRRNASNTNQEMTTPKSHPKIPVPAPEPVEMVPCPVCAVDIPRTNINLHLDRCLEGKLGQ